jgi:hypothetical protein
MNVKQDITPTSSFPVASHVQLESTQIRVVKQQKILAFLVMLVLIPRLPAQVVLVFAMHANQVGFLKQHRMPMDVKNVQKDTCKALKALISVNHWVSVPLDWGGVLQKS